MADNVAVTAGSGTVVAADDISSVMFQRVKQALGPDGTWTADQSGRAIGSDGVAYVDPRIATVVQAQNSSGLTTATTAYTAGDTLGAGWTFTNAARTSGSTGVVTGVALLDKADVIGAITLWFASGSITFGTDNAAPSVSDTDAEKILASLTVAPADLGGCRIATVNTIVLPYACDATSLFVYAVTGTGHTFFGAATDLRLRLAYVPD